MVKNKPKQRGFKRPPRSGKTTDKVSTVVKKKTLADYYYKTGSAKNASECVATTKFLLNHISVTIEDGDDVVEAIKSEKEFDHQSLAPKLKNSTITAANVAADPAKKAVKELEDKQFELEFLEDRKIYMERLERHRKNKATVAAMTWKLCTEKMKSKLQARPDFAAIEKNPITLLAAIKQHALSYESTQC